MTGAHIPTLGALVLQVAVGFAIFLANRKRRANQCFLLLSLVIGAWVGSLYYAFTAATPAAAEFAIRQASAFAALYLATLNLLRLSIRLRESSWGTLLRKSRGWLVVTGGIMLLCQSDFFLREARLSLPIGAAAPVPLYGPGIYIYAIFFAAAIVLLFVSSLRDLPQTTGAERVEMGFLLLGGIATMVLTMGLPLFLRLFFDPSKLLWFAPFRVVIFSLILAYGIATRRIMEVGYLLRRLMSYALLTAYLLALYAFVWWLVSTAFDSIGQEKATTFAHVAAAIVVAFAMAPARGVSQSFADRLFVRTRAIDFRATVSKAAEILKSVSTLPDLLDRFAKTISEAVGTDQVVILLRGRRGFEEVYATTTIQTRGPLALPEEHPLPKYLSSRQQPIILDELRRVRETQEIRDVIENMQALNVHATMGIFARDHLAGILLLGRRLSGRIYGNVAQNALQILCGQLAVAIENAQLFTEVQNAKIYNETLLQNLTTGVIAAGADEQVTVFNNEATEITGVASPTVLDRSLDSLPPAIRDMLRETLKTGHGQENTELMFTAGDRAVVVRASSSIFRDEQGRMLGALMVLTDITALKRLELQIRRSDRLASLGTLSAGMAHEIKNPLVSIKTFAQLLPERYQDSDFRETFSNLIGHEIDRIDSLVNQLLRFARPAKPYLKPMHVHDVLEKSLQLVGHRLYQKDIKLTRSWGAEVDTIRADADQLEQVFLNFFINAMDAMNSGGELAVATQVSKDAHVVASLAHSNNDSQEILRITIRDSGEGIRAEDLAHVFDPFFTTKDYGTGLGLSVVHGIIQEHGGQIEVESEPAKGTSFHILLPLVRFEREVAAA